MRLPLGTSSLVRVPLEWRALDVVRRIYQSREKRRMPGSKIKATATTTEMMALINASAYRPIGRYRRSKYKKKQSIKLVHRIQTRSSQYVASPPWTKQVCRGYGQPHEDTHGYGYVDRNSVPTAALERSNDVHRKHLKYFEPIRRAVHISFKGSGWNLM